MSNNPMIEQVNLLISNRLAGGGEVFLPDVGSLYVEWQGARRLSRRKIQPPCCRVLFSSQQRGESLVDGIAQAAKCDAEQAKGVYDRWLANVQQESRLTIEGVGVLNFKDFTLDPAFDKVLNPQGHLPLTIKRSRRFDWVLWFGVVAILMAVGIGGSQLLTLYSDRWPWASEASEELLVASVMPEAPAVSVAPVDSASLAVQPDSAAMSGPAGEQIAATAGSIPASGSGSGSGSASVSASASVEPAVAQAAGTPEEPAVFQSGRNYVVLGVFSTPENAVRAITGFRKVNPALAYSIYRFGAKLMISPFNAADAEACTEFIRSNGESFPGMWKHTAR